MNKDTCLSGVLHVLLHLGQVTTPQTSEVVANERTGVFTLLDVYVALGRPRSRIPFGT